MFPKLVSPLKFFKSLSKSRIPPATCEPPDVESHCNLQGSWVTVDDLEVYETGDKFTNRILICIHDIFGVHPLTQQVADKLAGETGCRVVIPDLFRGRPYDLHNYPTEDLTEIFQFIAERGQWEGKVKRDLLTVIQHYKEKEGINAFGIYGFGWGGRIAIDASAEIPEIQAAALICPSLWKTEDACKVEKPMLLLPSKDEEDMGPFYETLKGNVGEENVGYHCFDDMHHGFCGARGDLSNDLNLKRVDEALELLGHFFKEHLKQIRLSWTLKMR